MLSYNSNPCFISVNPASEPDRFLQVSVQLGHGDLGIVWHLACQCHILFLRIFFTDLRSYGDRFERNSHHSPPTEVVFNKSLVDRYIKVGKIE